MSVYKQGPVFRGGGTAVQMLATAAVQEQSGRRGGGHAAAPLRTGAVGRQRRTFGCSPERRKYTCRDEGGMGVAGLGTMRSIV